MADLEIGPERRQFVGQTAGFPQQAPVQQEIQETSKDIDQTLQRATQLLLLINKQRESMEGDQAQLEFAQRVDELEVQLANEPDIKKRNQVFGEGLDEIIGDINKKYPHMSPVARKSIGVQAANRFKQNYIKGVSDVAKLHKANFKSFIKNITHQAGIAKSDADSRHLMQVGLARIKQEKEAGLIGPDDEEYDEGNFTYKVNLERGNELLLEAMHGNTTAQSAILTMDPQIFGVHPQDAAHWQEALLHNMNQVANQVELDYRNKEHERDAKLAARQITPEQYIQQGGPKSKALLINPGHVFTPERDIDAENRLSQAMSLIHDRNELAEFYNTNVLGGTLPPASKQILTNDYRIYHGDLGNRSKQLQKQRALDLGQAIQNYAGASASMFPVNKAFNTELIKKFIANLPVDGSEEGMQKDFDDRMKELQEHYHVGLERRINAKNARNIPLTDFERDYQDRNMKKAAPAAKPTAAPAAKPKPEASTPFGGAGAAKSEFGGATAPATDEFGRPVARAIPTEEHPVITAVRRAIEAVTTPTPAATPRTAEMRAMPVATPTGAISEMGVEHNPLPTPTPTPTPKEPSMRSMRPYNEEDELK